MMGIPRCLRFFAERIKWNSLKHFLFPTLAIFTKRDGEGGIRLFAAQLPMSGVTQLKKPCQSAAVRQGLARRP